jgi:hypothetical protein
MIAILKDLIMAINVALKGGLDSRRSMIRFLVLTASNLLVAILPISKIRNGTTPRLTIGV